MFNKNNDCQDNLCILNKDISLKKVGAFLVSVTLLMEGAKLAKASEVTCEGGMEDLYQYEQQVLYNIENKTYDEDLCTLYNYGKYQIDNKKYGIGNVYIAYGYDNNNKIVSYIVCPKIGNIDIFTKEDYHLQNINLIRLCDTTAFIEMIKNGLLTFNEKYIMTFDASRVEEINNIINNWDGKLHRLVPELDIDNDVVIYEKR